MNRASRESMRLKPVSTDLGETPQLLTSRLPPYLAQLAVDGLSWLTLICSATSVAVLAINGGLQPEVAVAWSHPLPRAAMFGIVAMSLGFALLVRSGHMENARLLDLGTLFQVAVAFCASVLESATHNNPAAPILGNSVVGVWMMLSGRLLPMAPIKSALANALCVASWPAAYWLNLQVVGFGAMPLSRLMVRTLPLTIVAIWVYVLNRRTLKHYAIQHRAEEVGSYVLTKLIGNGGMGEVWQARHRTLARDAAVKLIRPELLSGRTGRQEQMLKRRFEREALVTAGLRSPNTVALYDYGQTKEGAFFYAMELLQGINLQAWVERFGPMEPGRAVHVLLQVAQSLDEAHQAGLVHRDIKPRNIMINRLGVQCDVAKVLDFGLVTNTHSGDVLATRASTEGTAAGTPAYRSPESSRGDGAVDARSDIYSLGCTAYFLLSGSKLFEASTPTGYALAHLQQPPIPLRERVEVPPDLEAIVMQMVEKNPDHRIQTARELARRLRALPCAAAWTPERAEQWWAQHADEGAMRIPAEAEYLPTVTAAA